MRVIDLLFHYATPGTVVVDLTAERAELSNAADGAGIGLAYQRAPSGPVAAPRALVLHSVLEQGDPSPFSRARPADEVVHVVFVGRLEALLEHGVLADAADHGHEMIGIHVVRHKNGRFAAVFARIDDPARAPYLRVINEYRYTRLLADELVAHKTDRDAELAKLRERVAEDEVARAEVAKLRREVQLHKKRGEELERQLTKMVTRLESARTSFSFRVGRATSLALKSARKDITAVPRRWLHGFRGTDEILEQARDELNKKIVAGKPAPTYTAVEIEMYRLGRPPGPPARTGVAGIASPRFAAELAATGFTTLVPHAWRAQMTDLPAYVLVTSDGLAPDGTWSSWGTIGGRDGEAALRDLLGWCRENSVPAVYWDTIGGVQPPRDVHFTVRFSIAPHTAPAGTELLAPAIEPTVWNAEELGARATTHALYCGSFDRRGDFGARTMLEGVLRAATGFGLQILDSNHGLEGTFSEMVRFPDSVAAATRRRPSFDAERAAMARAGVLIAAPPVAGTDVPSWQLLRGLALGTHVLACGVVPAAFADAVESATDEVSAKAALGRLFARPRLDATWRQAHDHVLASFTLRARLETIGERVRAAHTTVRATAGAT